MFGLRPMMTDSTTSPPVLLGRCKQRTCGFVLVALIVSMGGSSLAQEIQPEGDQRTRLEQVSILIFQGDLEIAGRELSDLETNSVRLYGEGPETQNVRRLQARLHYRRGELPRAADILEDILIETTLFKGQNDPAVVRDRFNLWSILEEMGEDEKVSDLRKEILSTRELLSRSGQLDLLEEMAIRLKIRNETSKAKDILEEVIERRNSIQDPDDLAILGARELLSLVMSDDGDLYEAETQLKEVVRLKEGRLGINDPEVLKAKLDLARVMRLQGNFAGSRKIQDEVLRDVRLPQGKGATPRALEPFESLALALEQLGNHIGSRVLQQQLAVAWHNNVGQADTKTLLVRARLAWTLARQGELELARRIQRKNLDLNETLRGGSHPTTVASRLDLALTLFLQGQLDEAIQHQKKALQDRIRTHGKDHPHTLTAMSQLARSKKGQSDLSGAEVLQLQVEQGRTIALGDLHPETISARRELAQTLKQLGRLDEARNLLLRTYTSMVDSSDQVHSSTLAIGIELAGLHREVGDLGTTSELLEEVMEGLEMLTNPDRVALDVVKQSNLAALRSLFERRSGPIDADSESAPASGNGPTSDVLRSTPSFEDDLFLLDVVWQQEGLVVADRLFFEAMSSQTATPGTDLAKRALHNHAEVLRSRRDMTQDDEMVHRLSEILQDLGMGLSDVWLGHEASPPLHIGLELAQEFLEHLLASRRHFLSQAHPETLKVRSYLAALLAAQGHLKIARDHLESILDLQEHRRQGTLQIRLDLVRVLFLQGDLTAARKLAERVLRDCQHLWAEDHPTVQATLLTLGRILFAQGDLGPAQELFRQVSTSRIRMLGWRHLDTVRARLNHARLLFALGDFENTRWIEEEALEILEARLGRRHPESNMARLNLASTLAALGDWSEARRLEQELLAEMEMSLGDDHPQTLKSRLNLAISLRAEDRIGESTSLLRQASEGMNNVLGEDHPSSANARFQLALSLRQQGRLEEAETLLLSALVSQQRTIPETLSEALTLAELADIRQQSKRSASAVELYSQALLCLKAQVGRLGASPDLRGDYRARYESIYRKAIDLFVQQGEDSLAFEALEQFQGRRFLTILRERELVWGDLPEHLDRQRRVLTIEHERLLGQLGEVNRSPSEIRQLRRELAASNLRWDQLVDEIRHAAPGSFEVLNPKTQNSESIRRTLSPGTVVLSYSVGESKTHLFVLTQGRAPEIHSLDIDRQTLAKQVALFRKLCSKRPEEEEPRLEATHNLGLWLFEHLLQSAESRITSSERVLVVPDGPLHLLPFAALVRRTDNSEKPWQYLAEWKPLNHIPSATVFTHLKKLRQKAQRSGSEPGLSLMAFGVSEFAPRTSDYRVRHIFNQRARLRPLPGARREVLGIASVFPNQTTQIFLDKQATEIRALTLRQHDPRILHFATHFLVMPYPLSSSLVLSTPGGHGQNETEHLRDGLLEVSEILEHMRLNADLVVLSACQTAIGPLQKGDGLFSMTRAFHYAGARSIAGSIWPVDDQITSELMIRFYKHLAEGESSANALQKAQVDLILQPIELTKKDGASEWKNVSAPYYWAAFQLYGD